MSQLIASALDVLTLFNLLAEDYAPRTYKQVCDLAARKGHQWAPSKIHSMLMTLREADHLRQGDNGEWSIHPKITAIAVTYQQFVIRRSQALLDEVSEIKSQAERML